MIRVVQSKGKVHLVDSNNGTLKVLATLSPDQANALAITLLKKAAVIATIEELKGVAHDENYH